jgi:hypothetical protein
MYADGTVHANVTSNAINPPPGHNYYSISFQEQKLKEKC